MDRDEKKALVDASLERAAELLGDITRPVYELYYARHPKARGEFEYHDPQGHGQLEGSMVEQVLHCLMHWLEAPAEIEIVLFTTIPHHVETLGVSSALFEQLLVAVCDTIIATIPPEETEERAVWSELQAALLETCVKGARDLISDPK